MISKKTLVVGVLAFAAACSGASAQQSIEGRMYAFHSKARGDCPALDWHVIAVGNRTLSGLIAWDDMHAVAHVSGTMDLANSTFKMTAKEDGGAGRTAVIDGKVRPDGWLVADIDGPTVTCHGISVPWYISPAAGG